MIAPMLCTLVDEPFDAKGWIFEIKWDGYRALAVKKGSVKLLSRNGLSFNKRYPSIVEELERLPGSFVLDGEIVIFDKEGRSHFQLLQNYLRNQEGTPIYCVFDILFLNGKDLRSKPLIERKKILKAFLGKRKILKFSDHVNEKGIAFFKAAAKKGLEGIIAKKADSVYQSRRSRDWLKIKPGRGQEVVIGGFTPPKGSRKYFGALVTGVYKGGKLIYSGLVGGGFNRQLLKDVHEKLKKLITPVCPFATRPKSKSSVTWVKPKLVCEVDFTEWTNEGLMRHPIFKGLRIDKAAKKVKREG